MNRPIKDIIYIDFSEEKALFHPENTILLKKWDGDQNDRELYDLMPFLESKI